MEDSRLIDKKIPGAEQKRPVFEGEVLVCEDSLLNRRVICDMLNRTGLKTVVVENGKLCVEMVQARLKSGVKQFDMIFMDIHMPVMDGFEATSKIQQLGVGTPIIAVTSNARASGRNYYLEHGMKDYIGKPLKAKELWNCLLSFLTPESWQVETESKNRRMDKNLRQKLIKIFIHDNKNKIAEIKEAVEKENTELAHRLVHTIKSNAAQLDFTTLRRVAEELEAQLSGGTKKVSQKLLEELETELDATLAGQSEKLQEKSATPVREASEASENLLEPEALKLLIDKLEHMLQDGNVECLNLIDELRRIPDSAGLIKHIENFDFERASEALVSLFRGDGGADNGFRIKGKDVNTKPGDTS